MKTTQSRNFIREILGKLNQMENVEYKFQILFVFGQSYMSKDAAKNLTKEWQLENKEHHDLIIAGIYYFVPPYTLLFCALNFCSS